MIISKTVCEIYVRGKNNNNTGAHIRQTQNEDYSIKNKGEGRLFFKSVNTMKDKERRKIVMAAIVVCLSDLSRKNLLQRMSLACSLQPTHLCICHSVYAETTLPPAAPNQWLCREGELRRGHACPYRTSLIGNLCSGAPLGPWDGSCIFCILMMVMATPIYT